ncbi:MAG: replicative DNA helicase [Chloroflexales bacterium]|nr:replicative DNA helicase [Chloroflexales bacterium]
MPYDIAAERATLGALLLERDAILSVEAWLLPEMFYLQQNEWIYQAIVACAQRRTPPDLATVAAELNAHNRLEPIGGYTFLGDLVAETPTAVHVEYYARIVEACAIRRALIQAGGDIAGLGYATEMELDATLDQAEQTIFAVSQRQARGAFTPIGSVLSAYFDALSALQQRQRATVGVPTGFGALDNVTGGLHASDLIIIGARPSMGKTSLALSMAYTQAMDGYRVGVISLEMSGEQLGQRLLAMHADLDLRALRTGRIADLGVIIDGMAALEALPLYVDDAPGLSISQVRAKARRLAATYGLDVLYVDYIQLMAGSKHTQDRVREVGEISRGLKGLARELRVPVVALSQLSRAVESRSDHLPRLSDLRDSGEVEQDADIVLFPYRAALYAKDTDQPDVAELHIAKHRNGPLGVVPLRFDARTTQFQPLERYRTVEGY